MKLIKDHMKKGVLTRRKVETDEKMPYNQKTYLFCTKYIRKDICLKNIYRNIYKISKKYTFCEFFLIYLLNIYLSIYILCKINNFFSK